MYNPFGVTNWPRTCINVRFPNAITPNPNPYAVHMYSFYPEPNRTPDDPSNVNNYASSEVNTVRRHTLNNRVDFKHGKHSIYGSGGFDYGDVSQPRPFGTAGFNDAPTITKDRNPYGQIGDTIVISQTLLLDVRYGATRIIALNLGGNRTGFTDYAAFGIPQSTQALFASYGSAPIVLPNWIGGGSGGGSNWTGLSPGQFVNKQEHQLSHALNASIGTGQLDPQGGRRSAHSAFELSGYVRSIGRDSIVLRQRGRKFHRRCRPALMPPPCWLERMSGGCGAEKTCGRLSRRSTL